MPRAYLKASDSAGNTHGLMPVIQKRFLQSDVSTTVDHSLVQGCPAVTYVIRISPSYIPLSFCVRLMEYDTNIM